MALCCTMNATESRSTAVRSVKKRPFVEAFTDTGTFARQTSRTTEIYKDPAVSDLEWVHKISKYLLSSLLGVGVLSVKAIVSALVGVYASFPKGPGAKERPTKRRKLSHNSKMSINNNNNGTRRRGQKKTKRDHRTNGPEAKTMADSASTNDDIEVTKVQAVNNSSVSIVPPQKDTKGVETRPVIDKKDMRPVRLYSKNEGLDTPSRPGQAQGGLLSPVDKPGNKDGARKSGPLASLSAGSAQVRDRLQVSQGDADTSVIVPNVTYGTSFFLRKQKAQGQQRASNGPSSLTSRLRRVYTHANSERILSAEQQQVFRLLNIEKQNQERRNPFFHLPRPRDTHYISNIEEREKRLTGTGTALAPIKLPDEAPVVTPEKAARYAQIHKARKDLEQQIAKLKLGEAKEELIPPVEPNRLKVIERYWSGRYNEGQIIGTAYKVDLMVGDVRTLRDGVWLNDNVIDFYAAAITNRESAKGPLKSFAFSTHFFSKLTSAGGYKNVMRWAKRKGVDVTKLDLVFVPINENNNHWVLGVVNNKARQILYYNSMSGDGQWALPYIRDYMIQEAARLYPNKAAEYEELYMSYELVPRAACPQQSNYYDCGVFTCKNLERVASGKPLNYSQKDMKLMRRHIADELLMAAENSKL